MNRKLLFLLLTFITAASVFAEPAVKLEDEALITVLKALKSGSRSYIANEAYHEGGQFQHDAAMAKYYPQLSGEIGSSGQNTFTAISSGGIEIYNNYNLSAGPKLSFSQLLPSNGTLSGSVSDSVSGDGIERSNSLLLPQQDPLFQNNLSLSIAYSQPLYFGDAYGASLSQVNNTLAITQINYLNNRNILIISAVEDYYNLITAKYQVDLIKVRLETNKANLLRMEKGFQLGIWTKGQLNSSRAASLQAEADLLKANQNYISAMELLTSVYGLDLSRAPIPGNSGELDINSVITIFSIDEFDFDELLKQLSSNNPDLMIGLNQIESAKAAIKLQQNNAAMVLSAGGTYSLSNGLTDEAFSNTLNLSLGLSSPIIDGGAAGAAAAVNRNELLRLENELDDKRKRTVSQMKLLLNNIILYRKLSEIYLIQEETGRFEYEKGLKEFELGGITQKDLLDLQIDLENTRLSILLNKIDNNKAVLKLFQLLGFDLEGMLLGDLPDNTEKQ